MQTAIQMPSGGCLSSGARARSSARATQQILCAPRRDVVAKARRTKTATTTYTQGERPDADTKAKLFNETVDRITRRFGDGSIMRLSDSVTANIETFPSGSLTLDAALGGGYPRGRIIEVYGPEASGKTTLAMHACAEIQRLGGTVAYIDVEHAFDRTYAERLGINLNNFWYAQPMTGEEALEVMDELCRSNVCDLVVIDSVAALVPRAELEGDIGSVQIGSQARLLSQALRKLSASASKSRPPCSSSTSCGTRLASCSATPRPPRRQRAQVLQQRAHRHPQEGDTQRVGPGLRQPGPRQGGEEQGGLAA
uniref:DNA recombination protein RecA, chloroplast n=1 Tax=Chlamydomonas reinhardtii TaxID=3055 RepID=A2PZD0_CHLRE|nr:DNA recombination protein RecA, chloroplast [Chlamydomonas reinhardtii]